MRRILLALGITAAACGVASAADLPVKAPPVAVVRTYNWTGFYIGGYLGYGWGSSSGTIDLAGAGTGPISGDANGAVLGVTVGYNWQGASPLVLGIEGDFGWSGAEGTVTGTPGAATINATGKVEWGGTIRGRIGYAFDRTMIYATGGGAYGEAKLDGTVSTTGAFSSSETAWAWVVGAGFETMITPNWSAKLEWLHAFEPNKVPLPPNTTAVSGSARGDVVRVGFNYKF